jgi:hypothetical protein
MHAMSASARGRRVGVLAAAAVSAIVLLAIIVLRWLVLSPVAPRINVRWTAELTDAGRIEKERVFTLVAGEHRGGTTWTYDLGDPSPANVAALIHDPAVADTLHIDRVRSIVAEDAPRGTTRLEARGLDAWRDSLLLEWVAIACGTVLFAAAIWLFAEAAERLTH